MHFRQNKEHSIALGMKEHGVLGKLPGVQSGWGRRSTWGVVRRKANETSLGQLRKDLFAC